MIIALNGKQGFKKLSTNYFFAILAYSKAINQYQVNT